MFNKKRCNGCGEKINSKNRFCPSCGTSTGKFSDSEEFGMLGQNDFFQKEEQFMDSFFGGISGKMIGKMLNSTMKMLEKEMSKEFSRTQSRPQTRTNVRLMINGREIPINNIESEQIIEEPARKKIGKIPSANFSKDKLKKLSTLPKQEPKTNIRRISNKIIYEMDMPKVDSIEDISIINLENNIEIKALAEDRVFFKIIPRLPITNYGLEKGKLIIELNAR